tara:strand:- start:26 stop:1009 length:984 start_codon:yes stop_codon:yes gene_type:complete
MIIKYFELKKIDLNKNKFFLLYGNNKGFIEETITNFLKPSLPKNIYNYDENELLKNSENFKEEILNNSFFENEKLIIIRRSSDKILNIIEDIIDKNINDISIIIVSNILEKKSKLRNFFEKNKNTICVAFYEDNQQTLGLIAQNFLKEKKLNISQQNINLLIERSRGDRINLKNELNKIEVFLKSKKSIDINDILKLTNLAENYQISEIVDNSLAKNKRKILNILNENILGIEDCISILRVFLYKLKRLLIIKNELIKNNNLENVLSTYKPPIFWKEKDLLKKQLNNWDYKNIQELIINTNEIELTVKKNPSLSVFLVTDFILQKAS